MPALATACGAAFAAATALSSPPLLPPPHQLHSGSMIACTALKVIGWMQTRKRQTLVFTPGKMDFDKLTKKVSNFHKSLMVYNWYFPKEDKTALFLVIHFDLEHAEFDAIFRAAKDFFGQKHQDSVTTYVNWSAGSGTQNNASRSQGGIVQPPTVNYYTLSPKC